MSPYGSQTDGLPAKPRASSRRVIAAALTAACALAIITLTLNQGDLMIEEPVVLTAFDNDLKTKILDQHNAYRCMHGANPLTWDSALEASANTWANTRAAAGCGMVHSTPPSTDPYGENLAWGSVPTYFDSFIEGAVDAWYDEVANYNFATGASNGGTIGHFTQVVWKATTKVGCAVGRCSNAEIIVCQYKAAGNYAGQYVANIGAITKTEAQCNVAQKPADTCPHQDSCTDVSNYCVGKSMSCGGSSYTCGTCTGTVGSTSTPAPAPSGSGSCSISADGCKVTVSNCAGKKIVTKCVGLKGKYAQYAQYPFLNSGMTFSDAGSHVIDNTANCNSCPSICENGTSNCA
eukprot:CAMPEP_0114553636 /NCGR_PEP_ID=MMETSP0114-20121206/7775_1 /TAXON_ID=31324 /ORGANISM="Goniomonas sp, Strain m" /LENGTH=347 /DNA_ID=CAMNT_0001738615 /DNA_START=12 /DNA_END=1055 /DNA_ORIENTATION=+